MPPFTQPDRRRILAFAAILALAGAITAFWFWKRDPSRTAYPLAPALPGQTGALWSRAPAELDEVARQDAEQLTHTLEQLDRAMAQAQLRKELLSASRIDELRAEDRQEIRSTWADLLEPLLALDELKHRYAGFWGIDYRVHPVLHARSFALTFAALCAEMEAGQRLMTLLGQRQIAPVLFDEAMPERGLPAGTFGTFRRHLVRSRDLSYVPLGDGWYHVWIERHLQAREDDRRLQELAHGRAKRAREALGVGAAAAAARNAGDVLKGEAFQRWFPIQKEVSEWAGDTRVVAEARRLISDAQIAEMRAALRPGDIIVERRNWYLSNVGLPGFWPHAALFTGTAEELRAHFDADPETQSRFGVFSEHLARKHPQAWSALGKTDSGGHPHAIVEAVSEGVVASSVEHSLGADYVAALRPRLGKVEIATALDRAFGYFGRPYDFNFDFGTDDRVVCSELVHKAYEPASPQGPGVRVPFIKVAGRRVVAPTELVRLFAEEQSSEARQLDFVYFLEGREREKRAVVGDAASLAATARRPKWDIVQP